MEKEKATRNTKQRTALLEILKSTKSHPNAFWLYDKIREEFPDVSLSTVYRNLGVLEKQKLLLRLPCLTFDRYDANTDTHTHFLCTACENVYDVDAAGAEQAAAALAKNCPHDIEGCNITFWGICENCKKSKN